MGQAEKEAILEKRARVLAAPRLAESATTAAERLEVLVFSIGVESMAIALSSIVGVSTVSGITPLPLSVAPVFGVTAWRGRPLTVLSLSSRSKEVSRTTQVIVLGHDSRAAVGLLVDSTEESRVILRSTLSPPHAGPRTALAVGVTEDGVLVLDAAALLATTRAES